MASTPENSSESTEIKRPISTSPSPLATQESMATPSPSQELSSPVSEQFGRSRRKPKQKKKHTRKQTLPDHLQIIQEQISILKNEVRSAYNIAVKESEGLDLSTEERAIIERQTVTKGTLEQLETLYAKLSTPETTQKEKSTLRDDSEAKSDATPIQKTATTTVFPKKNEEQILSLLHLFYLMRLSQQGFFSLVASAAPDLDVNALVHFCDKMVGGSLFAVKDDSEEIRASKRAEVFDMLNKLHDGVDTAIGDGYTMTYRQLRDLINNLIDSSLNQPQLAENTVSGRWPLAPPNVSPNFPTPPIWVVMPYTSMLDVNILPTHMNLPSIATKNTSGQNSTAFTHSPSSKKGQESEPKLKSEPRSETKSVSEHKVNADSTREVDGQEDKEQNLDNPSSVASHNIPDALEATTNPPEQPADSNDAASEQEDESKPTPFRDHRSMEGRRSFDKQSDGGWDRVNRSRSGRGRGDNRSRGPGRNNPRGRGSPFRGRGDSIAPRRRGNFRNSSDWGPRNNEEL